MVTGRRLLLGRRWFVGASLGLGALVSVGCMGTSPWKPASTSSDSAAVGGESMVLRAGHQEAVSQDASMPQELVDADALFSQEKYSEAERLFHRVAENKKNSPVIAEKARYYEAECLRLQMHYPRACNTYSKMLQDFSTGIFREQACARIFDIANYWLDDTRAEMERQVAKDEGRDTGWQFPMPFNIDKTKPTFDIEGHAIKALEVVHLNDITGPYADKSLWLCGYVQFFRNNFEESDHYLSQLCEHHRDSKLRPQAIELAIMAKNNSTGGALYDARKVAEAMKLVHSARATCPELVASRGDFLDRQLLAINYQQAEKDYLIADFYERTKHPGSAYFYYDLVKRRYRGTKYAELAGERIALLDQARQDNPAMETVAPPTLLEQARQQVGVMVGREEIIPQRQADAPTAPPTAPTTVKPALEGQLTGGSTAVPKDLNPNR